MNKKGNRLSRRARIENQLKKARAEVNSFKKKIEIEKDAKNEAYSFIIWNGHYNAFVDWHKKTAGLNHRIFAVSYLEYLVSGSDEVDGHRPR